MKTIILKYMLQNYFKLYSSYKVNFKLISNTSKLNAKKFSMKNNFTFQHEFQRKLDDKSSFDRIVSSDLLLGQDKNVQKRKKITLRQKIHKPSLAYRGEILFGVHPVYLALLQKKRTLYHLYIRKEADFSAEEGISRKREIIKLAESMNIPISFIDSKDLKILTPGVVHQGVCLDVGFLPLSTWSGDQPECQSFERPIWLVLDEILDPMNVGAIIRSAYYFGVDKLFTLKENSCKLSPIVSKASSGSLEIINLHQIENLKDFIMNRKNNGWHIVSTLAYSENKTKDDKPSIRVEDYNVLKPTVLVLGNEGRGISQDVKELCDSLISIESGHSLHQGIDSLNVSVAAGVILYVLSSCKKRREHL